MAGVTNAVAAAVTEDKKSDDLFFNADAHYVSVCLSGKSTLCKE